MGNICGGMSEHPKSTHGARATLKDKHMDEVWMTVSIYQEAEPKLRAGSTTWPEWRVTDLYFADVNGGGYNQPLLKVTREGLSMVPSNASWAD